MIVAIGKAYNGLHKVYKKELSKLKVDSFYFNIDNPNWAKVEAKNPDAYLWHADNKEENYDHVLNRVDHIQNILHKPIFPDLSMYLAQGNKLAQYQTLTKLKIPTPKTYFTQNKNQALKIIKNIDYPFILKDPYGYGGHHIFKIDTPPQAKKYVDKVFGPGLKVHHSTCKDIFYAQEFIPLEKDLRVITLGNKVFCAYWRVNTKSWKHNLDQGGQAHFDNIPSQALDLCLRISKKLKFHWMAYDVFIKKNGKIYINEYSCNFSAHGAKLKGLNLRHDQMAYLKKQLIRK